jgi:uncharacterized protein DUF6941
MKVTLLLADAAEAVNGKLYILGGGWSVMGPDPAPMAIAIKIEVPWNQGNDVHKLQLRLVDADGRPVLAESEEGEVSVVLDADFETGRPAGVKPGTPLDLTMAVTLGPLPLEPGSRFEWRLTIDGVEDDEWRVAFSTRAGALTPE